MVTGFYFIVFVLSLVLTLRILSSSRKVDVILFVSVILVTINCLGRYLLASAETLELAVAANKVIYVGACYAPLMLVIALAKLCNRDLSTVKKVILLSFSTVIMLSVMTIGKSELYYKQVELGHGDGYNYLIKEYGPFHSLYVAMIFLYIGILVYYLFYALKNRKRISSRTIIAICGTSFSIFFVYLLERIVKSNVSFLSLGYLVGIVLLHKYFERLNMYDMSANIYYSIENMNEYGYIAFDNKCRYVNANHRIKQLFPEIEEWIIDKEAPISDSYLYTEAVIFLQEWNGEEGSKKTLQVGESYYQLSIRSIPYGKKKAVGFLMEFIDRTIEKKYYNTIEKYNVSMEKEVAEKAAALELQQKKTKELFLQIVTALSDAVDAKDRYTSGHSKRVAEYSRMIAARMGKSKEEQEEIYRTGLLHDVGKIRIPEDIINKPGKLTDEEFNIIKIHPATGYHILRGISEDSFLAIGAKYHHERYDGKGYPNGLCGEKIPEVARILAVADSYDAMASNRSYRDALPQEVVRNEIEKGKGTQFDPHIAEIMLQMIDEDKEYCMKQIDSMHRKILTVDDEAMNNKIIAHIMKDEPMYEVVSAGSGKEALDLLKQQEFDLIMLDVNMPEMDGLETLKLIRKDYSTPVVLMTSDKMLDTSAGFAQLGCDDYITKPFLPLLIKEVVHNMTERTNVE